MRDYEGGCSPWTRSTLRAGWTKRFGGKHATERVPASGLVQFPESSAPPKAYD